MKTEPNNHGWLSELIKRVLRQNNSDDEKSSSDNLKESSDSDSGSDGGIKIPMPEWPPKVFDPQK